jgi:hypothetical protein
MLTDEVDTAFGRVMRLVRFAVIAATLSVAVQATAFTVERLDPSQPQASVATSPTAPSEQVPLLYVVDGVRYQRDQIPVIDVDQVLVVKVIKGQGALDKYGRDAAYGVVVITTRQAVIPQA